MMGASVLLRIYAQRWAHYAATYGSLAAIMLLLTWLWESSVELLVAAALDLVVEESTLAVRMPPTCALRDPLAHAVCTDRSDVPAGIERGDGADLGCASATSAREPGMPSGDNCRSLALARTSYRNI
jgi:membrane protein